MIASLLAKLPWRIFVNISIESINDQNKVKQKLVYNLHKTPNTNSVYYDIIRLKSIETKQLI